MKKLIVLFVAMFVGLLLMGCPTPIPTPTSEPSPSPTVSPSPSPVVIHTLIVKDSLWRTTKTVQVLKASMSSRALTDSASLAAEQAALNAQIDAYNALTTTDLLRVYVDTAPEVAESPDVNIFICNPDTNLPNMSLIGVPRQQLIDNYAGYQQDAAGGQVLYVDHIPPAPILSRDVTPFEWWSMYAIEDAPTPGVILYEDHAGYHADESFHGQWITTPSDQYYDGVQGGGWASLETYYSQMLTMYNTMCGSPASNWPGVTAAHMYTRAVYPPLPTNP